MPSLLRISHYVDFDIEVDDDVDFDSDVVSVTAKVGFLPIYHYFNLYEDLYCRKLQVQRERLCRGAFPIA